MDSLAAAAVVIAGILAGIFVVAFWVQYRLYDIVFELRAIRHVLEKKDNEHV